MTGPPHVANQNQTGASSDAAGMLLTAIIAATRQTAFSRGIGTSDTILIVAA